MGIGRFGQPKAVLVDILTYNWQKQAISLIKRIDTLTPSETETLNILLDDRAREALLLGLQEAQNGNLIPLSKFGILIYVSGVCHPTGGERIEKARREI